MGMSQTTFDDDLFGEAAAEIRDDVESHLAAARAELPTAEDVWETGADNVLGVLNGLKTGLNTGDAEDELHQAKKWFTIGERADAFDDADDLREEIEELEDLLSTVAEARDQVSELTGTIPALRGALEDAHAETEDEEAEADEEAEEDDEAEEEDEGDAEDEEEE